MEQLTSVRHRLLVTSHLQEIPQDIYLVYLFELTVYKAPL